MKLNIPPLSQRDNRWKDKRLGGGGTIGLYGCLLICHAMALAYYGHETSPDSLNEIFKSKGAYDGNYLNFYAVGNVFGDYKAVEFYECNDVPCDLSKIDKMLAQKKPVIAKVDFDQNPSTKGDWHFVLIIGKEDDGAYYINDPWTGETYYFNAKYGDPLKGIYGLRIYDGIPPKESNYEDRIQELTEQVKSANESLAEKSFEVSMLTDKLTDSQNKVEELQESLNKARSDRDSAIWENDQLKLKNKTQEEEIKALREKIVELEKKAENWNALTHVVMAFKKVFRRG